MLIFYLLLITTFAICPKTIIMDPAGSTQSAGRVIGDCYERGIALQFCYELKKAVEQASPDINFTLTRNPGERVSEDLQGANFSNRINPDLFLSIHFYAEEKFPEIGIYYFDEHVTVKTRPYPDRLNFIPYTKAYFINSDITQRYADIFYANLKRMSGAHILKPVGAKIKPLVGIAAPAILIEFGLVSGEYKNYVNAVRDAVLEILG